MEDESYPQRNDLSRSSGRAGEIRDNGHTRHDVHATYPLRYECAKPGVRRFVSRRKRLVGVLTVVLTLPLVAAGVECVLQWRDSAQLQPPGRMVSIGDRRLHLHCEGSGEPTVILEATGTHFHVDYAGIQSELAQSTKVCAYDRAGMGFSDESDRPLNARHLADDLGRLLDNAGLAPPFVLVAASGGGLPVELFARERSSDVAALVFIDAVSGDLIARAPDFAAQLADRACLGRVLSRFGLLRLLDPLRRGALLHDDAQLSFALTYQNTTWDSICSLTSQWRQSADQIAQAPPLDPDLPMVVLTHGRVDNLTGLGAETDRRVGPVWQEAQRRLASCSTRGRLIVVEDATHRIVEDRPDLVLGTVGSVISALRYQD